MKLTGCVFIAADTARSQIYAQAMLAAKLVPQFTVVLSPPMLQAKSTGARASTPSCSPSSGDDFVPNLSIPLLETLASMQTAIKIVEVNSVNTQVVAQTLTEVDAKLAVYSGFGGQIVGDHLLSIVPFLHIHGGGLPEFRGSTTVYYSILESRRCGYTGILLNREIDAGNVVVQDSFPPPSAGTDIDYVFDNAMRAKLLIKALHDWGRDGYLSSVPQPRGGRTFYVIHPILKHLSILSLEKREI